MHTPQQVLVVDDDEGIRELVAMALSSAGYDVMSAPNGAAALELLATSALIPPLAVYWRLRGAWAFRVLFL